ncbi:hypothetical protein BV372_22955 [Nostoc sp. T09]|uniref:hypothetical protein n=1 Tax=Nostoc sp. T09 TaxID=1932621 RepID=UPI000A3D1C10|nr:hypothetical protein [Nostoc sp. T09]OUL29603.1 hypothetical protein BV372_22955 [Nostoc sp. T09]
MRSQLFKDAKFDWYGENYLRLLVNAIYGGIWIFWYTQLGKYQVRFTNENSLPKKKMLTLKEGWAEIDGFWTGKLTSHFADLILKIAISQINPNSYIFPK